MAFTWGLKSDHYLQFLGGIILQVSHPASWTPKTSKVEHRLEIRFCDWYMWARVDQHLVLGMGNLPPLIGNPYNGYITPTIGLMSLSPIFMYRWMCWKSLKKENIGNPSCNFWGSQKRPKGEEVFFWSPKNLPTKDQTEKQLFGKTTRDSLWWECWRPIEPRKKKTAGYLPYWLFDDGIFTMAYYNPHITV